MRNTERFSKNRGTKKKATINKNGGEMSNDNNDNQLR